jgi:hypothetical protein
MYRAGHGDELWGQSMEVNDTEENRSVLKKAGWSDKKPKGWQSQEEVESATDEAEAATDETTEETGEE